MRLVHLGIAEGVVACLVVAALVSSRSKEASDTGASSGNRRVNLLILASVIGVFALILSGSYMVGYGAGSSCATWPLCRGSLMPDGTAYAVHMGHRFLAAAVGLIVVGAAVAAWRRRASQPLLGSIAMLVVAMLGIQTMIGAATVWAGFSTETRAAHLGGATLLWTAVVALATVLYVPLGLGLRTPVASPIAQPQGIGP
ncbi:MAG: COX15/CtaA family protein [Chloroflexi bacterium]|nr:COX15/CtaA family protein [Chloroflexota bacterium]